MNLRSLSVLNEPLFASLRVASVLLLLGFSSPQYAVSASGPITGIWANEGGDKVTQDELRATRNIENKTGTVVNRAWDGQTIRLTGASNETVSFDLILEAGGATAASNVSVAFDTLTGPGGSVIKTKRSATANGVFDWVDRPIELFFVRYVEIKGMSAFGWFHGSEGQIPLRFQASSHLWKDRPDHNKFYPDALVPLELVPQFGIARNQNQSIWADIYIPKATVPGTYTGVVTVRESGVSTHQVPVSLIVKPFGLPDAPAMKAFTYLDANEIQNRYVAPGYVNWQTPGGARIRSILEVYEKFFHRHGVDLIGGDAETPPVVGIHPFFQSRYSGELYTAVHGYDGRGVGVGTSLYAIGSYGTWGRNIFDEQTMWRFADPIADWFHQNFPNLQFFIYLQDEPDSGDFSKVEAWAKWLAEDPGSGRNLQSMATVSIGSANAFMPSLQIPTNGTAMGECPPTNRWSCDNVAFTSQAVSELRAKPDRQVWQYAASHPGSGTSNTEDDGVAMRTLPWAQFKMKIDRWFYWYGNLNSMIDWYQSACTWDCYPVRSDDYWGLQTSGAYTNGNGLLVYPGSDINYPQDSYGVDGPFASLRLKEWRRGIQDGDYLAMAKSIDPVATDAIVQRTMPTALWENKAPGWPTGDPSYFNGGVSWSSNPDDWESAREQLAAIIVRHCQTSSPIDTVMACSIVTDDSTPVTTPSSTVTAPVVTTPATPTTALPDPITITPSPAPTLSTPPTAVPDPIALTSAPAPAVSTPTPIASAPVQPLIPAVQTAVKSGSLYVPITPCRVVDSRMATGSMGFPFLKAGQSRTYPLPAGGCNLPTNAKAYSINVTVVPRGYLNYLTVWPTGQAQPLVSNLNSYDGRTKSVAAIVPAGTAGGIDAFATGDTEVIIDVDGYFLPESTTQAGLQFFPVAPCRVADTREAVGPLGGPFLPRDSNRSFPVLSSLCGLPATAQAYSLNFTAIPHQGLGWLSAWPTGLTKPTTSILNAITGAVTANAAIIPAGTSGEVSVYVHDESDLVIDVNGYFAEPAPGGLSFFPVTPCRAFDSRLSRSTPMLGDASTDLTDSGCGIPSSAGAVVINATTVPNAKLQYLSLWPAGQTRPVVSTLNAYDGQVTSNLAMLPTTNGSIASYLTDKSHLIFDVTGYFK